MIDWRNLTQALSATTNQHAPGWTDRRDPDPGITLLELIAYLATSLARDRGVVEGGSAAAARIVEALAPYEKAAGQTESPPGPPMTAVACWSGHTRPRFFSGQLLTAEALSEEQSYHLTAHRRHVRALHGYGVVSGLEVGLGPDGGSVVVGPGYAIDAYGRDIVVACALAIPLPSMATSPLWVAVEYVERHVGEVPVVFGEGGGNGLQEANQIEEGCRVLLAETVGEPSVAIACLLNDRDGWHVEGSFVPARPR